MPPHQTPKPSAAPDFSVSHPFSVHDLVRFQRVVGITVSPNGNLLVATKRVWNNEENKWCSSLWLFNFDAEKQTFSAPRQLTAGPADHSPIFSPDSRYVVFLSSRQSLSSQMFIIPVDGGEARLFSKQPVEMENLRWSPAGDLIAFSAQVFPDCVTLEESAERQKQIDGQSGKAYLYSSLPIREWDRWLDAKKNHVFLLEVTSCGEKGWATTGRAPHNVMHGRNTNCPRPPFNGVEDFNFSPDGKELAYTAKAESKDEAWSTNTHIYRTQAPTLFRNGEVSLSQANFYTCVTEHNEGYDGFPEYSPCGRYLAYLSMKRNGFESDQRRVMLLDTQSGQTRQLCEEWLYSPESLAWSSNGQELLVVVEVATRRQIVAIDINTSARRVLVSQHTNVDVKLLRAHSDRLVFLRDSMTFPAEIFTAKYDGSEQTQVSHFNADLLKNVRMSQPEEFYFSGAKDEQVQGWILQPVDFDANKKYPCAVIIHGGPQSAFGDHWHYRWNLQTYAGAGFVTVVINFHGSSGFGQPFTDSISGDWGGAPFEDIMKGVDFVVENYEFIDKDRIGALGASYGGYMINWINGHTNRFKCLVNHDGQFDSTLTYFTTEELFFPEWEFKGLPWQKDSLYSKWSPHLFVDQWQTPTLVIHGGKDYRLTECEGIATFTALQRRGVPSEFLYFPEENHWVLRRANSIIWHDTVLAWLHRWL